MISASTTWPRRIPIGSVRSNASRPRSRCRSRLHQFLEVRDPPTPAESASISRVKQWIPPSC
ncbi:hypothetical protein ACFFX0_28485 [Citricoccus parietis]|uniref:Uncharacterized protein n=1 Tax=Citricoccus parietis TaxID=592307 RepID=A0ABV5FSQ2_9MICC